MSLSVEGLYKKYGEKVVVDHLSFTMQEPGVYALLGTNGAGKTTSIRMMLGILAKDGGQALWNGAPLSPQTTNVGYLAEERGLYPKYSLMDQVIYFAGLKGVPRAEAEKRIRYWAERLEAEEYFYPQAAKKTQIAERESEEAEDANKAKRKARSKRKTSLKPKLADQLSKGNQQKVQFMIALISDPQLLILDEPLSGLDPVNTDLFKGIIRDQIAAGKYLIMSSHQMATVEEFCTDITILDRSKTVLQGNLNEIKKSYGRVNLHLKTEGDAKPCIAACGAQLLTENAGDYQLKVSGEEQAMALLRALMDAGLPIITFDLREPSLHEIFVEKVGGEHE